MSARRRCAETECRHSPRAHNGAGCSLCGCSTWLDSKRHIWREDVTEAWFFATQAWLRDAEAASIGYATELREFEEKHPRPRLADFMDALSLKRPADLLEALFEPRDICSSCGGTGQAA